MHHRKPRAAIKLGARRWRGLLLAKGGVEAESPHSIYYIDHALATSARGFTNLHYS